jgi:hypothetical protein
MKRLLDTNLAGKDKRDANLAAGNRSTTASPPPTRCGERSDAHTAAVAGYRPSLEGRPARACSHWRESGETGHPELTA